MNVERINITMGIQYSLRGKYTFSNLIIAYGKDFRSYDPVLNVFTI